MVLGTDGGVAADVADDAAADLPRPRLGRRGRCEQDGEGEAQQEELPPAREGRGHGCDRIGLVGGMKPSRAVDSLSAADAVPAAGRCVERLSTFEETKGVF